MKPEKIPVEDQQKGTESESVQINRVERTSGLGEETASGVETAEETEERIKKSLKEETWREQK